jgi:ParB family chromosome partitioning protein
MTEFQVVSESLIDTNPGQPRKIFSEEELDALTSSIKKYGVLQPMVVVQKEGTDRFLLVAGERRLRACRRAGVEQVPVVVRDEKNERENLILAMVENLQRANLNPIEEALAYEVLLEEHGCSQEELAQQMGKDRSTLSNYLRLLRLPAAVKTSISQGRLSMAHAKQLLGLTEVGDIEKVHALVLAKGLSVRQTQQLVEKITKNPAKKSGNSLNHDLEYLADGLRNLLRTKVKISGDGKRGKIEIAYFSAVELERIFGKLMPRR